MNYKKSITIIIPNYNGESILKENLPIISSIANRYNAQIIVVDDASTDGSLKFLNDFPQIKVISKQKNEGFSSTVNIGVNSSSTELVCLLNSDVLPSSNFLESIFPYFDDPQIAGVGMQDESDDRETHGRGRFIFHRGFLLHQKLTDTSTNQLSSGTTGWASCGSAVFSKKIWDELGGLDETLNPFYFEDVDFGFRCWRAGYKDMFESISTVKHVHKTGAIKTHYQENKIKTISYRNQFIFNWKNLTDISLILQHVLFLPMNFAIALKSQDWPFFSGFFQAIMRISQIIGQRNNEAKNNKLTDHEILNINN
ncbi:MAG: glycosyltransferase family 2 protein [bacterium]|nr:glycosyltransferase family 2 protein [bacterium]